MGRPYLIFLLAAALLMILVTASLETGPGYMDADYYYAGGLRIAAGEGDSEPYLWNYLNDIQSLPAPSFAYWMPLTSLLAAAGMALSSTSGFWAARLGFLLLGAAVPPLTAWLSYRLTGQAAQAKLAGVLALFSGFYLAYLPTTDSFSIYMLLGSLFLVVAGGGFGILRRWPVTARFGLLGALAGLMHMTRADGILWLGAVGLAVLEELRCRRSQSHDRSWANGLFSSAAQIGAALFAYGLVAAPWMARNLRVWNSLLPPGGSRAMWITDYPQTMSFPASHLTFAHWLSAGWGAHFEAWFTALGNYVQSTVAVQGTVILFPFILIGMWKLRHRFEVRLAAAMWLINLLVMTVLFPYAGVNGGFFHSGAAFQPLLWAVAPRGLQSAVDWYAAKRRFSTTRKISRFATALILVVCAVLTVVLTFNRVVGRDPFTWKWNADSQHYRAVESQLLAYGADPAAPVLVNNPPAYWLASGRLALVIPAGEAQTLLAAARQFQVGYLVFETTNPVELADLYHGRVELPELEYLGAVGDTKLYRFNWNGVE